MQRLQQKQLERLRQLKNQSQKKQMQIVKKMLQDQSILTIFNYCHKILLQPLQERLSDYSPSNLSKFVFDQQLQKAKALFQTLPNGQSTIQHFLLIMISIMKFPFEKWPYYLVGVKDMYNEILVQKADSITYRNFFKYIIGQVLDFKQEQQNTQFQVRFQEHKKQDYLLHDTGIKKSYYSTDTKYFMTLDQSSPVIKLYNKQMRMVHKFTPNKQKHNKKYPNILHFDYSQMSSRLGIVLSDSTFSIINLQNYLTKSKYDFDIQNNNQIVISLQNKMLQVYYIQMLNKWILISDINKIYTFDFQKYKQNDPLAINQIKLQNPDLKIFCVLEIISLSMICIVAGNQIYFYNQNFMEIKHSKFVHGTNIKNFKYCEELGQFFISGQEKYITIVTVVRAADSFIIRTFDIQSKYYVSTFDVFPAVGTIVAVDSNYEVRLFDLAQGTCYQLANYSHIVKKQNQPIKMLKISKTQFALYQTYNLVFNQQKIAIQKDTQFNFLPRTFYDQIKQQFYLSVNNQIISFSVFQGQIRKSFNLQTANVPKHYSFILGKRTNLFIIDYQKNIYQAYMKDRVIDGENRNYKKKVNLDYVIDMFYDEDISHAFVVGNNTINTIRNDTNNNFTVTSVLNLEGLPEIHLARYNTHQKYILALTKNQSWLIIDVQSYKLVSYFSYKFPTIPNQHLQTLIQHFQQDEEYNLNIILNNKNQLYILSNQQPKTKIIIKLQDYLPYKIKHLQFKNMRYCQLQKINKKYLLLSDQTGYLIQINITNLLGKYFQQNDMVRKQYRCPVKDINNLQHNEDKPQAIHLNDTKIINLDRKDILLLKGHDTQIKILQKIYLQGITTLTISTDGHIKLWKTQQMLFHLKLPDLKKISWNMQEIQKIKNQRSVNQVVQVLNKIANLRVQKPSIETLLKRNKIKAVEYNKDNKKFNINQPIQIQIDNKELEEVVQKTQNINWYTFRNDSKRHKQRDNCFTQRNNTNYHPWRRKAQFKKIMQKASPQNKYLNKMPLDLKNMRNSLDMIQKSARLSKQYKDQLTILPQINSYVAQSKNYSVKQKNQNQIQDNQNEQTFQSCLYIKNKKDRKNINEFDEIDKQFKKKWLALTAKRWVFKSETKKKPEPDRNSLMKNKAKDPKTFYAPVNLTKYDPIKQVKNIFENHNRQTSLTKKGRLIKIPDIRLKREDLFNND